MKKELEAILGFAWTGIGYIAGHFLGIVGGLTAVCILAIYFHKALREWGIVDDVRKKTKSKHQDPDSDTELLP